MAKYKSEAANILGSAPGGLKSTNKVMQRLEELAAARKAAKPATDKVGAGANAAAKREANRAVDRTLARRGGSSTLPKVPVQKETDRAVARTLNRPKMDEMVVTAKRPTLSRDPVVRSRQREQAVAGRKMESGSGPSDRDVASLRGRNRTVDAPKGRKSGYK